MQIELIQLGILASLVVGLATGIGAVPVLFFKNVSHKITDSALGFAGGVMIAASIFSLLIPAIDTGGTFIAVIGFVFGSIFVYVLDRHVPHTHILKGIEGPKSTLSTVSLMMLAVTIHNFPEGLAVGVGFGAGDLALATTVAMAIALQNIPEGMAIAFPLIGVGLKKAKASLYALLTGLAEPIGGVIGVLTVTFVSQALPFALAFAAGAMVYVVSDEMIPESHRRGHELEATFGFLIGFIVMMILDTIFL
ncbi:MAG: ZIP family metal transporter [Nitrososphaerota archaeon]